MASDLETQALKTITCACGKVCLNKGGYLAHSRSAKCPANITLNSIGALTINPVSATSKRPHSMIADVETTGFPDRGSLRFGEYPNYQDAASYEKCRIVKLSYMLVNEEMEPISTKNMIIRPDGFHITNSHIHGVTNRLPPQRASILSNACASFRRTWLK